MKQEYVEILKIAIPVVGTIIVAVIGITIRNKNMVKNNKSNNMNNSENNTIKDNNYGINNKIGK